MMTSKKSSIRRAQFERLEDRNLMAGHVLATFENGVLELKGDRNDNGLVVHQTRREHGVYYDVQGIDTKIIYNGHIRPIVAFRDVTAGIKVELGRGSDFFNMYGMNYEGFVDIALGSGNDRLYLDGVDLRTTVDAGSGDDTVRLANSLADVDIVMGSGNDNLTILHYSPGGSDITITLGRGNDRASIVSTTIYNVSLRLDAGRGNDLVALSDVTASDAIAVDMGLGEADVLLVGNCVAEVGYFRHFGADGQIFMVNNTFGFQKAKGFRWKNYTPILDRLSEI